MTILIVDDLEENLYQLRVLLGASGYEVITAANGSEALAAARRNPPDLTLSDILMPVMDGFSLCREWKKDERLNAIPFVFYTATYTDERDRGLGLGLGAEGFIVKPVEPEVFLATIREVLHGVRQPPAALGQPAMEAPGGQPGGAPELEEVVYLRQYNEALIRKLERKVQQLEQANRQFELDAAEQRRAEEALRESEERFRILFEQSTDCILLLEIPPEGTPTIRDANSATFKLLGYERDELIGQLVSVIDERAEDPRVVAERQREPTFGESRRFEVRHRCKDGTMRYFECSMTELAVGSKTFAFTVERDITRRKQAEARMAEQLDELRRWHETTMGREGRVLELKKEVNELLVRSGQPPRYPSAGDGE